jgi:hypothetical protein
MAIKSNEIKGKSGVNEGQQPPLCHMTPMKFEWADDGCQQVEYWVCEYCGHTKEISRHLAG